MQHETSGSLCCRHHLRHQQRVRLRLPARQHGLPLEDRVQRGLNFAIVDEVDSILIDEARTPLIISGPRPTIARALHQDQQDRAEAAGAPGEARKAPATSGSTRSSKQVHLTETGTRMSSSCRSRPLARGPSLYDAANIWPDAPPERGAARARAVPARCRIHRARRRGHHRRRVHRPHDAGPALVRRPAPGGRGEGRRADPAREPDARLDHLPELLPHVRQARRHDRHGRHRGLRVPADLQPRSGGDPDHRPMVRKDTPTWSS
jgi:hypothetical protein